MQRRNFLTSAGLLAAGAGVLLTSSCNDNDIDPGKKESSTDGKNLPAGFELDELTVEQLQQGMDSGKYTSAGLVTLYFRRMDELDTSGPKLQAVIERNPDAVKIAEALDGERKAGKKRGPLHGIPVLIKDNIDTGDQMQTTAGSLALVGNKASADSFIAKKLREAGAVIIGKTNLSEWANFRSTQSCSGWSSRGGQTKNPYITDHNPCGSSSGSGVAVSANLCAVAIGTETDGSITCPASVNGIVGIKPTVGLVSRTGIIPISSTQDTAGPMARTVRDAAILLGAIAGTDPADAATAMAQGNLMADYTVFLKTDALKGKRIGIDAKPPGKNPLMIALLKSATDLLRAQGAELVEISYLDQFDKIGDAEFELMQYEFREGVNKYLAASNSPAKSLAQVISFNILNEPKAMPYFKQETLESSEKKGSTDGSEYKDALKKSRDGSRAILDKVIADHQLDAIAGLTMGPACSIDTIYGDRWGDLFLTQPAATSGYPHISVPAGFVYDLPVGFSFFGKAWSEGKLISLAYAFEQAGKHRKVPGFKASFF
ncbi:MAG: amidase [Chitinophagaceae bacterium]|nr:MAG: amidase [Chitinophagaceae bacterium]